MSGLPSASTSRMPRVAVVGGGIAGLAAAYRLERQQVAVHLFEAGTTVGGVIQTNRRDGFLVETGPNTLVARSSDLTDLIEELGLSDQIVRAPANAAVRYVVRGRRPVPLPTSPRALLTTQLISWRGRLRGIAEPFVRRPRPQNSEESVAEFVRRRFGGELLDYAVDPFVSGIYAGDPERLSLRYTFPLLAELEAGSGSIVRGGITRMRRARKGGGARPDTRPFSFKDGLHTLPRALAECLNSVVRLRHRVTDVEPDGGGYFIHFASPDGQGTERFDAVILALPPTDLADLSILSAEAAGSVTSIPTPPVAALALGFRREDVRHSLEAFGMLVPGVEPFRLLGALFSSSLFPGRAPEGHVLLTCFLGGRRQPEDALLPEDQQVDLVLGELRELLGVTGTPTMVARHVWPRAIPQYEVGYGEVLNALDALEDRHRGLAVAGNIRRGVSVGDTVASGQEAAERVAIYLRG